ncbi:MAG TPA: ECF-type sigma factor [Bryobacteraceae bacterium]|nr:ECF-type sigma factor [Bryobacteraceae bacterium]
MDGSSAQGEVTLWLERWSAGDSAALEQLTPLVYDQLRHVAAGLLRREREDHTLQPTALVHEAFQQLLRTNRISLRDRAHFFTFAARLMRRILIDHARRLNAAKRGMSLDHVPLNPELAWIDGSAEMVRTLDLEGALNELAAFDGDKARAIELRYFLGCTVEEIAATLGVSPSSVERDLRFSLAWLRQRLHPVSS